MLVLQFHQTARHTLPFPGLGNRPQPAVEYLWALGKSQFKAHHSLLFTGHQQQSVAMQLQGFYHLAEAGRAHALAAQLHTLKKFLSGLQRIQEGKFHAG